MPTFSARNQVAQKARDGVLLDAEIRHHPGVDDVAGGQDHADFLVHGHDHMVVHLHEVELTLGLAVLDLRARRGQRGEEFDAAGFAIQVFIAPLPLVAGDLDGQVRAGSVLHGDHGPRGRQRHGDDDNERNDGPGDLDAQMLVKRGRLVAARPPVRPDGIEHHTEHTNEDHDADREHHPVQPHRIARDLRHALMQIQLIDTRSARHILHLGKSHVANQ